MVSSEGNPFQGITNGTLANISLANVIKSGTPTPVAGDSLYLSDTAGKLTSVRPNVTGELIKPVFLVKAVTGGTTMSGYFHNMLGLTAGGTNVFTVIPLSTGTSTIQNMSVIPEGETASLEGTIKLLGGTNYVFRFKVSFSRQIGGTYHVGVPTFSAGDIPPTGFSFTHTGSSLQVVCPTITSGQARFAMDAAHTGTSLPLSISASSVLGSTSGVAPAAGVIGEVRAFTNRVVSAVTANFVANASALDVLPAGHWAVYGKASVATGSVTSLNALISTNIASDATGDIGSTSITTPTFSGFATAPLFVAVVDVATTLGIYAKANTSGANANVTVSGFAIRIG